MRRRIKVKLFNKNPIGFIKGRSRREVDKLVRYAAYKSRAHLIYNDPSDLQSYNQGLLSYVPAPFKCWMYMQGWKDKS